MRRREVLAVAAVVTAASVTAASGVHAPAAGAASELVVRGAGFGHGVGLSQYGARGFALRGSSAEQIVEHYYRGTRLGRLGAGSRVRVLLQQGSREATVSGARTIGGIRVRPDRSYRLVRTGSGVAIVRVGAPKATKKDPREVGRSTQGVRVVPGATPLRVSGIAADGVRDGSFRGALDVLPDGPDLVVVNDVDLEDYLGGVVTAESPSSWPAQALRAQAIVARTYAITSKVSGRPFDQWPDTRSQVYRGIAGESATGLAAIAATRGRIVTYGGKPVVTYFFSTSGGRTEDVQNVFGGPPQPYLRSVRDPYEASAPLHRWTRTFDPDGSRARRLGAGRVKRIVVLERGASRRVLRARVVGSAGTVTVDGGELQRALSLPDRWASPTVVSVSSCLKVRTAKERAERADDGDEVRSADGPAAGAVGLTQGGGRDLAATIQGLEQDRAPAPGRCRLVGGLAPAPAGTAVLERRTGSGWRPARRVALDHAGRFDVTVARGRWRVAAGKVATADVVARR